MPQTQLAAKYGSNNSIFDVDEWKKVPHSMFPYSCKVFDTVDVGELACVDVYKVYPGDRIKQKIRYLLETLPLAVPPYTNFFVRTHAYFVKTSAVWSGHETMITRGRSGSIDLEIPSISDSDYAADYVVDDNGTSVTVKFTNSQSLGSHMGLPPLHYVPLDTPVEADLEWIRKPAIKSSIASETGFKIPSKISALQFLGYQKIWRFAFANANLLQDNKIWYPDDLSNHWRLNYAASNLRGAYFCPEGVDLPAVGEEATSFVVPSAHIDSTTGLNDKDNCVNILQERYVDFSDDYFNTAKPWIVRGEESVEEFDLVGKLYAEFLENNLTSTVSGFSDTGIFGSPPFEGQENVSFVASNIGEVGSTPVVTGSFLTPSNRELFDYSTDNVSQTVWSRRLGVDLSKGKGLAVGLTANTFRNLICMSVLKERLALTNGNYNRMVQALYGRKPHAPEYEPLYLGGSTDLVNFAPVIQTSASVSNQPLGTKAALGGASGQSELFDFEVNDFGYIYILMFVIPESIYAQGIDRQWTDLTYDSEFIPQKAALGYQSILNQEICATGSDASDLDLFGWQTRYAYLKHRRNAVRGLFALKATQDRLFGAQVVRRSFSSVPKLSPQFVSTWNNVARDWLGFPNYPAFKVQFASDVDLWRALPWQSRPETFGF